MPELREQAVTIYHDEVRWGWCELQGVQQLGNKKGQKVSAQSQVNEPCHGTGQCQSCLDVIPEGICSGGVLGKDSRADRG